MQYSSEGFTRTKTFEGLRLVAYSKNGDVWTIGWGHTKGVRPGQVITISQAEEFLTRDIIDAENLIYKYVTVELNQHQFDAVVDAAFNMGEQLFRNPDGSATKFLRFLNSEQFHNAAVELLNWDHFRGRVLSGLLTRRRSEMMEFELPMGLPTSANIDSHEVASAADLISASQHLIAEGAD